MGHVVGIYLCPLARPRLPRILFTMINKLCRAPIEVLGCAKQLANVKTGEMYSFVHNVIMSANTIQIYKYIQPIWNILVTISIYAAVN